jgi:hypothetical protein
MPRQAGWIRAECRRWRRSDDDHPRMHNNQSTHGNRKPIPVISAGKRARMARESRIIGRQIRRIGWDKDSIDALIWIVGSRRGLSCADLGRIIGRRIRSRYAHRLEECGLIRCIEDRVHSGNARIIRYAATQAGRRVVAALIDAHESARKAESKRAESTDDPAPDPKPADRPKPANKTLQVSEPGRFAPDRPIMLPEAEAGA